MSRNFKGKMLFFFSVSLLMPKKLEYVLAYLYLETRNCLVFFFFLSLPFQIASDFAFIIKIKHQLDRP